MSDFLLFAMPCRYLHQHKIAQSREIYNTKYRKVKLKVNKQFHRTYISSKDTRYNIQKKYISVRQYGCISSYITCRTGLPHIGQS